MNKDIFFYSTFCEHCKEIMTDITKHNLHVYFMFVCVDNKNLKIPTCVTHVPTIITKQKDILTDTYVAAYIQRLVNTNSESINDISPYSLSSQAGYSSSYTWLTENGYDNDGKVSLENENMGKNSYVMLGTESRMFAQKQVDTSKANKFDDSMYEKYINSRNADDEFAKRQIQQTR